VTTAGDSSQNQPAESVWARVLVPASPSLTRLILTAALLAAWMAFLLFLFFTADNADLRG
jgi:hypothetical protein